MNYIKQSNV